MKHLFIVLALLCLILVSQVQAQSLAVKPVYHFGNYTGGEMEPGFDWDITLTIPITSKFSISPGVYYYWAHYKDFHPLAYGFERYWYLSLEFSYTFSEEPLFK